MATCFDWTADLGEDWILEVTCHDGDGNVLDLTNGEFRFRMANGAGVIVDARVGAGVVIQSPATDGIALVTITPSLQGSALPGTYSYVGRAIVSSGVSDQVKGRVTIMPTPLSQFP